MHYTPRKSNAKQSAQVFKLMPIIFTDIKCMKERIITGNAQIISSINSSQTVGQNLFFGRSHSSRAAHPMKAQVMKGSQTNFLKS